MKDQLIEAINSRKVVEVTYTSKKSGEQTRLFYPFTVGKASNDKDAVFGLQLAGGGGSHPARYNLENLKALKVLDVAIPDDQPETYEVGAKRWTTIEATIAPRPGAKPKTKQPAADTKDGTDAKDDKGDKALRIVEVQRNTDWQKTRMMDLVPGDKFRMFEPDGTPVTRGNGDLEWTAVGKPYIDQKSGRPTIEVNVPK